MIHIALFSVLVAFVVFTSLGCVSRGESYPVSDHYDGKHFFNPEHKATKGLWSVLKWQLTSTRKAWPQWIDHEGEVKGLVEPAPGEATLTFINHATTLVRTQNLNLLTDPVWSERVSPFTWIGPKRVRAPGLDFDALPPIHVVIISHNHYDHLDLATLKKLHAKFKPLILVPLGDAKLLRSSGIDNVEELDWWQSREINGHKITFMPSLHWSGRGLHDRFDCLWGSYGVELDGRKIYFAGDTGYSNHFNNIRERWGSPDISLIPVGAYEPRWFMKDYHMNPAEAVQAFLDLQSKKAIGIHHGTFQLTDEGIDEPAEHLMQAREAANIKAEDFRILEQGETWVFKKGEPQAEAPPAKKSL